MWVYESLDTIEIHERGSGNDSEETNVYRESSFHSGTYERES